MRWMRRIALAALLVALACCSPLAALAANDGPAGRPNVLFIIVDDLRPQLGAYGFPEMHTPSIDRLAAQGALFERAYVQWPVCGPSRASLLSGLRPETSGVHYIGQRIQEKAPDAVSLPRHFRQSGYRTLAVGKVYHHRDEDPDAWSEPPWDLPDAAMNWQGYASPASHALRLRQWQDALAANPDVQLFQFNARAVESADLQDAAYRDGQIALKAVAALNASAGEPFFLAVGFVKPHLPFAAPKRYWDLHDRAALALPEDRVRPAGASELPYLYSELRSYHGIPDDLQLSQEAIRELLHGYRAAVSFIDAQVGLLLDALQRLKLADNTIVVLLGDHGFHLGEQDIWGKHSLFERSLRAPLILRVPGWVDPDARFDADAGRSETPAVPRPAGVDLDAWFDANAGGHQDLANKSDKKVDLDARFDANAGAEAMRRKMRNPGARIHALVEFVDIYPTLCELAGLEPPPKLDGRSFAPLLENPAQEWKAAAHSQYRPFLEPHRDVTGRSVRTERHRYTEWRKAGELLHRELYDLSDGGLERTNLANDTSHAGLIAELAARLRKPAQPSSEPL